MRNLNDFTYAHQSPCSCVLTAVVHPCFGHYQSKAMTLINQINGNKVFLPWESILCVLARAHQGKCIPRSHSLTAGGFMGPLLTNNQVTILIETYSERKAWDQYFTSEAVCSFLK